MSMRDIYTRDAEYYDIAFDWDVTQEVDWLIRRLGKKTRRILEPGCGSGRMFLPFIRRGIVVTGIDNSQPMLDLAKKRIMSAGYSSPALHRMDMANFNLGDTFDGAVMPINTFGYLASREQARDHLCSVARHLRKGGKYMIQVDMKNLRRSASSDSSSWEMEREGIRVKMTWNTIGFDPETLIETQLSRIEVLSGPDKGSMMEEEHLIRRWDWESWKKLLKETPFVQSAAYDGNSPKRPSLPMNADLNHAKLTWHELLF